MTADDLEVYHEEAFDWVGSACGSSACTCVAPARNQPAVFQSIWQHALWSSSTLAAGALTTQSSQTMT